MPNEFGSGSPADVRINVSTAGFQSTLEQLVKLGVISDKNAQIFTKNNEDQLAQNNKLSASYRDLQKQLETLFKYRAKAATAKDIETIDAQIKGMSASMDELRQKTEAADGAMGSFVKKASSFSNFATSFRNALLFGGVAGIGFQVGRWALELADIRKYITAFADLQQAEERLAFAVKNIAKEGQNMTDRLIDQANHLQKVTQFARVDILEAQTKLMTQFNLSAGQTETVLTRIVDVAAGTGKSIDQIAQRLGAGMEGRVVGLKQLGFNIKYAGDATDVLNQFMKESAKDEGEAAAKMETLSGQIEHYKNVIETAKQATGGFFADLMKDIDRGIVGMEALFHIPGGAEQLRADILKDFLEQYQKDLKVAFDGELDDFTNMHQKEKDLLKSQLSDGIINEKQYADGIKKIAEQTTADQKKEIDKRRDYIATQNTQLTLLQNNLADLQKERTFKSGSNAGNAVTEEDIKAAQDKIDAQMALVGAQMDLLKQMENIVSGPDKQPVFGKGPDYTDRIESMIEARKKLLDDLQNEALINAEKDEFDKMEAEAQKRYNDTIDDIKKKQKSAQEILDKPGQTPKAELDKLKGFVSTPAENLPEGQAAANALNSVIDETENKRTDAAFKRAEELQKQEEEANKKAIDRKIKHIDDIVEWDKVEGQKTDIQIRENSDKELQLLEDKYSKGLISLKKYTKQKKVIEDQDALDEAKNNLVTLQAQAPNQRAAIAAKLGAGEITQQESDTQNQAIDNTLEEQQNKIKKATIQLQQDIKTSWKDTFKEITDGIKEVTDTMIQALLIQSQEIQKSNDYRLKMQDKLIQEETALAIAGKENTLAFQIAQADKIEAQQLAEQKKQKHLKELEILINAVAKFAEKDPTTALAKGFAVLAAVKGAEAIFAEEGGIIGQISQRSVIGAHGYSRTHTGGNDVLLHAQKGEGILSVPEMQNLGAVNFGMLKNYLKRPLNEKPLLMAGTSLSMDSVVEEVRSLKEVVKNKKETNVNWDEMNNMIVTEVENGVKKSIKYIRAR